MIEEQKKEREEGALRPSPFLQRPFYLGSLRLESNIFCSPLAGCSDYPFRQMLQLYRPGLVFCEMVKMEPLLRFDPDTYRLLDFDRKMHPIGAQICGASIEGAALSARMIEDLGFDVLDLNCGCPVDKVTKDGSGSALLKSPEKIGEIVVRMVQAVSIPVTVKIRAGWDESMIVAPLITQIVEQAGAKALFVHGRTRAQGYKGPANRSYIKACKEKASSLLVFGNGDIFTPEDAASMFQETKCDGVLLSRGLLGSPWLIAQTTQYLMGKVPSVVDCAEKARVFALHMEKITEHQPPRRRLVDERRIRSWYKPK